ncbi:MAG TPA: PaaI family thioesterase [Steroidobacteraceae bacterium]|nr:PaaI family thioesterase [Steroidobacteraceae bacterium]
MSHPYADLIGLKITEQRAGFSMCMLTIEQKHFNPHRVVNGAVMYALADIGMGTALYLTLGAGEICATIQITMNYFKPVQSGVLTCASEVINRGKSVAHLESRLFVDKTLVASASGNFSIFKPSTRATT